MRCLYIVSSDPISENFYGGASALYYDQLIALTELRHEVHLWHYASKNARLRFNRFINKEPYVWEQIKSRCASVTLSEQKSREPLFCRVYLRLRSYLPPRIPASGYSLIKQLRIILKSKKPDFIWAQHFDPATLAIQQKRAPTVYVHHDWLYRIKALRSDRAVNPRQKIVEERLVRSVEAIVTGSATEREEIAAAGGRRVHYIPVSYEPVKISFEAAQNGRPRLVHLGGMGTTANREGLVAFFKRVWPSLKSIGCNLRVVGDISAAPPELKEHLCGVDCTGFVQDLKSVLRPFDIHIIPWEHSTGQRTRLPVAFNYGQVVVAAREGVACYPEAQDGVNCRLVNRLEDMVLVIKELIEDHAQRLHLGRAARETFDRFFTRPVLLPRYAEVIASLGCN